MYSDKQRSDAFKKNNDLELVLAEINRLIAPLNQENLTLPKKPIILVMGCARSGSTLLMQYLASLGNFSYPTNLIARFYKNPYLGILIQKALVELDDSNQIGFKSEITEFNSDLGKTSGALQPSEFWYFWREYFKFSTYNFLSENEQELVDTNLFFKKLSAFESLTNKPLLMKGMMLNWNIPYLYSIYNKFIFINLERDVIDNAQSLLQARQSFFGDKTKWYSFKPLEYESLKNKTPEEQVIGQVMYTQNAIKQGLKEIPLSNQITINYNEFCLNPSSIIGALNLKFKSLGLELDLNEKIDAGVRIKPSENKNSANKKLEQAYNKFPH